MTDKINFKLFKPFGSTMAKAELPNELVKDFLKDLNDIRQDPKKIETHAFGHKLAGQIYKEFLITPEVLMKWKKNFFDPIIKGYVQTHYREMPIERILIHSGWYVVQKPGDYNCCHTHTTPNNNPDLSCVGYLKFPKAMKDYKHSKEHHNTTGYIEFLEGSESIFNNANYLIQPLEKQYFLFPSNLRHTVYPFFSDNELDERISFSFNASVMFDSNNKQEKPTQEQ